LNALTLGTAALLLQRGVLLALEGEELQGGGGVGEGGKTLAERTGAEVQRGVGSGDGRH